MAWLGRKVHSREPVDSSVVSGPPVMVLHPSQLQGHVDEALLPRVLLTDRALEPDRLVSLFGFRLYEWIPAQIGTWREGAKAYGLSAGQWREWTIIVERPGYLLSARAMAKWFDLKVELQELTGRRFYEHKQGHLIFR